MKTLIVIFLVASASIGFAQNESLRQAHFNVNTNNVVNDGYDPVSYFARNPMLGKSGIKYTYQGVIYWFNTEANRVSFKKDPRKYEPQYGGWCAYALGHKPEKVRVNPETYKILNGKLYLFYNFRFTNTLKLWNTDETNLLANSAKNWNKVIKH